MLRAEEDGSDWKRPEFRTGFIRLLLALIILHCHICTCVARVRVTLYPLLFFFLNEIFLKAFSKGITRITLSQGSLETKNRAACSRERGQGASRCVLGEVHVSREHSTLQST